MMDASKYEKPHKSKKLTLVIIAISALVALSGSINFFASQELSLRPEVRGLDSGHEDFSYYECLSKLPQWVGRSNVGMFAEEMIKGSNGLTDKTLGGNIGHRYQFMYHRYLSPLAQRVCEKRASKKIRILEIGLGCHKSGGMLQGTPGGSALAWRYMFPSSAFDLDLHIMEFDEECARNWDLKNPGVAHVHFGDQGNVESLRQVMREAGDEPFDLIIDDGSHLNEHQILTLETLIHNIAPGGIFIVEDIQSACLNWGANTGAVVTGQKVGGTVGCMETTSGKPTIFAHLMEMQKKLIMNQEPHRDVMNVDIGYHAAALQKKIYAEKDYSELVAP